jgi:L-aminopeptidase/D-esterase-like protein
VHAVLLTGGSAFGLDAAGGVMRWLEERGHGLAVGPARVPIVPAAVLFDLWVGDGASGPTPTPATPPAKRPRRAAGPGQCRRRRRRHVGKLFGIERAMKGGIGTASLQVGAVTSARWWPSTPSATSSTRSARARCSPARAAPMAAARRDAGALLAGEWPPHAMPAWPPPSASSPPTPC